jgi:addiction module HigA family antidote
MPPKRIATIHPGRVVLEEFLGPCGISVFRLANEIGISPRRLYEIVQGQRPINADIAHRLAHYFGMSERYWLDLQARYDLRVESDAYKRRADRHCLAVAK